MQFGPPTAMPNCGAGRDLTMGGDARLAALQYPPPGITAARAPSGRRRRTPATSSIRTAPRPRRALRAGARATENRAARPPPRSGGSPGRRGPRSRQAEVLESTRPTNEVGDAPTTATDRGAGRRWKSGRRTSRASFSPVGDPGSNRRPGQARTGPAPSWPRRGTFVWRLRDRCGPREDRRPERPADR